MDQKTKMAIEIDYNALFAELYITSFRLRERVCKEMKDYEFTEFDIGGEG